ncbi:MAG: hypothetical protein PsegKO_28450 [Pseudohongiellaceae bacterium]
MLRVFVTATLISILQACAASADTSVDGNWDFSMSSPFGTVTADVVLITANGTLTGSFDLGNGRIWPIENGTVTDNKISFAIDRDGSPMVYQMSATIDGDAASGVASAMGTEVPWSMTRGQ